MSNLPFQSTFPAKMIKLDVQLGCRQKNPTATVLPLLMSVSYTILNTSADFGFATATLNTSDAILNLLNHLIYSARNCFYPICNHAYTISWPGKH